MSRLNVLTREFYIPKGSKKIETHVKGVEVYEFTNTANYETITMCFVGKTMKPTWRIKFSSEDLRQDKIQKTIEKFKEREIRNCQIRADAKGEKAKAIKLVNIGDVFVQRFCYDSSITSFYQVVHKQGLKVELMQISMRNVDKSGETEMYMPNIGDFYPNRKKIARVSYGSSGNINLRPHHGIGPDFHSWDGKAQLDYSR